MDAQSNRETSVDLLKQLGLKEYEAKCFVALTRMTSGTAREVSEASEVPRTRVYDAIRVLESKGLVQVQHTNPQRFRAMSIEEAVETLRREYEDRADTLMDALEGVEPLSGDEDHDVAHEVWSLSGSTGISNRVSDLVQEAEREVVYVVGDEVGVSQRLLSTLSAAHERGITVIVGTASESLRNRISENLPDVEVFRSELEWLRGSPAMPEDDTVITRLLLVDRTALLVSSIHETEVRTEERAVYGNGFDNGFVAIARRLMATGLVPGQDPGAGDE